MAVVCSQFDNESTKSAKFRVLNWFGELRHPIASIAYPIRAQAHVISQSHSPLLSSPQYFKQSFKNIFLWRFCHCKLSMQSCYVATVQLFLQRTSINLSPTLKYVALRSGVVTELAGHSQSRSSSALSLNILIFFFSHSRHSWHSSR